MLIRDHIEVALEYKRRLTKFRHSLLVEHAFGSECITTELRIEHLFECLRDWSLWQGLEEAWDWYTHQVSLNTMQVHTVPLTELRDWSCPEGSAFRHRSGQFFVVEGIRVSSSSVREVGGRGWDQPIITEIDQDGGLLGLLRQRIFGVPHYLVEAKAEPGNYRLIQLSPTLQATFSNLRRAHGGRKPRFSEYFEHPEQRSATVIYSQWLSEDGGRFRNKRNRAMLVEVPEDTVREIPSNYTWLSMYQIKALLQRDACINPHIRGIIAHL